MNILQIANKATFPPDGGSLAILSIAKAYIKCDHNVHLLNMVTHKHNNNAKIEEPYKTNLKITGVNVNTKVSLARIFLNFFFSRKALISIRFISKRFKAELAKILIKEKFDFIQLEGLYVLPYISTIRKHYKGKVLYRPHNIEHIIWKRQIKETKSLFKKVYLKSLSKRIEKLEKKYLNTYDYLIPISQYDADIFNSLGNRKPYTIAPFGINLDEISKNKNPQKLEKNNSINYIGALDWIPNQEGLLWFINECLPEIIKKEPDIKLNIAGRNAPEWLINKFNQNANICFCGEVENAYTFIQNTGPMIVPLFSGSGMRVKIIEGMALKKTIIATSIAAEGINAINGANIIIADDKGDYIKYILSILNDFEKQKEIGENAYKFVESNYNFKTIANNILDFIK